jgi:hypothetical protein
MNRLSTEKRTQMLSCLVEGNSLRATARMCDVAFNTVLKFIPEIGEACDKYQDKTLPAGSIVLRLNLLLTSELIFKIDPTKARPTFHCCPLPIYWLI